MSTPIINPPQSAVLGLHRIEDRPVVRDGQVVIRPMMYIALSYDHRLIDGREAVTALKIIKEAIEDPTRLLIDCDMSTCARESRSSGRQTPCCLTSGSWFHWSAHDQEEQSARSRLARSHGQKRQRDDLSRRVTGDLLGRALPAPQAWWKASRRNTDAGSWSGFIRRSAGRAIPRLQMTEMEAAGRSNLIATGQSANGRIYTATLF